MSNEHPHANQPSGGWQPGQQPPPQGPYGQPGGDQQFGGQQFGQPPYQQQPNAQYGGQAPGSPYGGPPPKRRRTGLIVALIIVALVLVGGGIALALTLGGDDKHDDAKDDESSSETKADAPDPDVTVGGTDFSFGVPEGWSDVTDQIGEFSDSPPEGLELMAMSQDPEHAGDNVLVQKTDAEGETDPEALKDEWSSNLLRTDVEDAEPREFDGAESVAVTSSGTTDGGNDVDYHGFLVIHEGSAYSILHTASSGDEEHAAEVLEMIETSWSWE